jgi:hypothetical protein
MNRFEFILFFLTSHNIINNREQIFNAIPLEDEDPTGKKFDEFFDFLQMYVLFVYNSKKEIDARFSDGFYDDMLEILISQARDYGLDTTGLEWMTIWP